MRKIVIGFIIGFILALAVNIYAYRISSPPKLKTNDLPSIIQLNNWLEEIWELTKGKYSMNIATVNPDGNTSGNVGDMLLLNVTGTYYLEVNINGGTKWYGVQLTDTP